MREFKFRARDGKDTKWIYWSMGDTFDDDLLVKDMQYVNFKTTVQYTGLKDKNGKEIYEGDVIRGPHDFGPGGYAERTGVIEWHGPYEAWKLQYWDIERCEVIGNIHENPELVK